MRQFLSTRRFPSPRGKLTGVLLGVWSLRKSELKFQQAPFGKDPQLAKRDQYQGIPSYSSLSPVTPADLPILRRHLFQGRKKKTSSKRRSEFFIPEDYTSQEGSSSHLRPLIIFFRSTAKLSFIWLAKQTLRTRGLFPNSVHSTKAE